LIKTGINTFGSEIDVHVGATEKVEHHDPPALLTETEQELARGLTLALTRTSPLCPGPVNATVLRDLNTHDILVYFLPASTEEALIVLAGITQVRLSPDGSRILPGETLAYSCLTYPSSSEGAGLFVKQLATRTPTEAHVYTSLGIFAPLYVGTDQGIWRVRVGKIEWLESLEQLKNEADAGRASTQLPDAM
jgi:hypothetical protein